MRQHMRRLAPVGLLAVTAAFAGAMLGGTGLGSAATQAEADEPGAADDPGDAAGRVDAHGQGRPVDGQPDRRMTTRGGGAMRTAAAAR